MTADPRDWITAAEGRAAVNLEPTDLTHDSTLELWITAISLALEAVTGPVVSRALATCTDQTDVLALELDPATTELAMTELVPGREVSIGTAAAPYAVAGPRRIRTVQLEDRVVTIDGPKITTTSSDTVRSGRYATTDDVPRQHKLACSEALRSSWAVGQGSGTLGDPFAQPLVIAPQVWTMLAGLHAPGYGGTPT